ncbi:FHA domain-containing protein [Marisediminicola senii]|uniref:FHA domain-containing protein n=1 Tax=Marisediminicola senii TaxID=2711233 RepID=UPI0013E9A826|nr:FHA domain-containing protein [Marisediminicola senii]
MPAPADHLHRIAVNAGAPLELDVPTIIGRRPSGPRVPGPVAPRLLTVTSSTSAVSATHLTVHQRGSSVVVTDMHSTNGTVVTMPGLAPVLLRPGESIVAVPGTLVNIGDGNIVEILPDPRLVANPRSTARHRGTSPVEVTS